jgi:hypothetical protein
MRIGKPTAVWDELHEPHLYASTSSADDAATA